MRERIFMHPLAPLEEFVEETATRMRRGLEYYFVLEQDGVLQGFSNLVKKGAQIEALTWGKWLNTLVFVSGVCNFEILGFPSLMFSVRHDNKRVIHLYRKFDFRKIGNEMHLYRMHQWGGLYSVGLYYFEVTAEEFKERRDIMERSSVKLTFQS